MEPVTSNGVLPKISDLRQWSFFHGFKGYGKQQGRAYLVKRATILAQLNVPMVHGFLDC